MISQLGSRPLLNITMYIFTSWYDEHWKWSYLLKGVGEVDVKPVKRWLLDDVLAGGHHLQAVLTLQALKGCHCLWYWQNPLKRTRDNSHETLWTTNLSSIIIRSCELSGNGCSE